MVDVNALNREFSRYDQVTKSHTYRLAEYPDDEFDDDYEIAALDFSRFLKGNAASQAAFIEEFAAALQEIGFAVLTGHGIDPTLYDEMHDLVIELFESCSLDEKMRFRAERHGSVNQGYFPMEETSDIHPDQVEGWVWCRRAFDIEPAGEAEFCIADFWPDAKYERAFRRLVLAHEALIIPIAQAMFAGLGCDPQVYDGKLTKTNFGLRLNYYPALRNGPTRTGAGRLLGHEDVDLFTLLPAPRVEGLQVWNHRSSKWVRLRAPEGSVIINTGDYMQRISNDRLPSTTHRVALPGDESLARTPRVSFPMAIYVGEEEVLEVLPGLGEPKYEPIKAITFHTRSTSKFYGDDYAVETSAAMVAGHDDDGAIE
jgi:isopenicillin N synthase-like dioxygenase